MKTMGERNKIIGCLHWGWVVRIEAKGMRKFLETMGIFYALIVVVVSIFVYIFIKIPITLKRINCNMYILPQYMSFKKLQKR